MIIYLSILFSILNNNLHSKTLVDIMFLTFSSIRDKIEFGADYVQYQSLKFQDGFIVDIHTKDFQNSFSMMPSLYISFKSKGYSVGKYFGLYLNSTLQYSFYDRQRALLTEGSVSALEVDLDTSIHYISFYITPSFFYYLDFGDRSGKNSLVFELFSGLGLSLYTGTAKRFIYPTKEEFIQEQKITGDQIPPNFQISSDGTIRYIGDSEELGIGLGFNLLYGLKLKYIYNNYNIHFTYQAPIVITIDDYLNIQQFLIGVGYTF